MNNNELQHYGILGMKWGKRKARGHAGLGTYFTKKRQLAGDKRDLKDLNNGQHLSIGFTKKRQEAYDRRDKAALEKRIAKNESSLAKSKNVKSKNVKSKNISQDAKEAYKLQKKKVYELSNAELKKLNERQNLERTFKKANPNIIAKGAKIVGVTATTLGTIAAIKGNSKQVMDLGKDIVDMMRKKK